MRAFLIFLAIIVGALLIAGLLAHPAWLLVTTFMDAPIHRVMHRIAMLLGAIGLFLFLKRLHLANAGALGYALPSRRFIAHMLLAFAFGVVLMGVFVVVLFGLDVREVRSTLATQADPLASIVIAAILLGILRGFVVAFIEETFFRGALFSAIRRESGIVAAIALPSLIYAAVHFLGGGLKIPAEQVTYTHSLALIPNLFEKLAAPQLHLDSFVALFALGVLLSLIRLRTGAIAGCIGMHAAGVCVITVTQELSIVNQKSPLSGLVGSYNGILGWLAFAWFVVITVSYAASRRSHAAEPDARGAANLACIQRDHRYTTNRFTPTNHHKHLRSSEHLPSSVPERSGTHRGLASLKTPPSMRSHPHAGERTIAPPSPREADGPR